MINLWRYRKGIETEATDIHYVFDLMSTELKPQNSFVQLSNRMFQIFLKALLF